MSLCAAFLTWFIPCPASQVAYLVRSPYWWSHVEVQPAVLCTEFASDEERQTACTKWAVRGLGWGQATGALAAAPAAASFEICIIYKMLIARYRGLLSSRFGILCRSTACS